MLLLVVARRSLELRVQRHEFEPRVVPFALQFLSYESFGRRVLGRLAVHPPNSIAFYLFFTFPSLLNNFVVRFFHLVESRPRDVAFGFHVFEVAI